MTNIHKLSSVRFEVDTWKYHWNFKSLPKVDTFNIMFLLLPTIFHFALFALGEKHANKIEISGVYTMDKVEGDMQGFNTEHLKSFHQLTIHSKEVTTEGKVKYREFN